MDNLSINSLTHFDKSVPDATLAWQYTFLALKFGRQVFPIPTEIISHIDFLRFINQEGMTLERIKQFILDHSNAQVGEDTNWLSACEYAVKKAIIPDSYEYIQRIKLSHSLTAEDINFAKHIIFNELKSFTEDVINKSGGKVSEIRQCGDFGYISQSVFDFTTCYVIKFPVKALFSWRGHKTTFETDFFAIAIKKDSLANINKSISELLDDWKTIIKKSFDEKMVNFKQGIIKYSISRAIDNKMVKLGIDPDACNRDKLKILSKFAHATSSSKY